MRTWIQYSQWWTTINSPSTQKSKANLRVFSVTYENEALKIVEEKGDLAELLAENLGVEKVTLIPCGDGNIVAAAREQWNDGSNTLTIAPGVVVVYDRNTVTNKEIRRIRTSFDSDPRK